MNTLRLLRLTLRNFKGVREFTLDAQGSDVAVYGDNAAGKTTLFDAFKWVLFGKDSVGRDKFQIKTLQPDGRAKHNLEHSVEAVLNVDGQTLTLLRVFKEKWTRKRGSATAEHTGHTTDFFIDGVPVKAGEYAERINELVDEGVFRLLTDPNAFNALHWTDRRRRLLEVCGDVTDDDVIASTEALKALPEILGKRTLEEHRKVVAARRKDINEELQRIPVRVDEATRSMPDEPEESAEAIESALEGARAHRSELEEERARIQAGGQAGEAQAKIREIEGRLHDARRAVTARVDGQIDDLREHRRAIAAKHDAAASRLQDLTRQHKDAQEGAERARARAEELRAEYRQVQAEQPDIHTPDTCPACKRALPAEDVQAAHEEALAQFNTERGKRLTKIRDEGHAKADETDRLESQAADLTEAMKEAGDEARALQAKLDEADANIQSLSTQVPDTSQDDAVQALEAEKASAEAQLAELKQNAAGSLEAVQAKMRDVDENIRALEASLATHQQIRKTAARIAELQAQEKELAAEFEELERQLHLADEFTRTKVTLLEDRINSKFELARFKLFDEQINGGLAEGCDTTYQGVPYGDLNHGATIRVGLDIVRTLQRHYNAFPPVWIDQAEAVTRLIDMPCQTITLTVSAADPSLRVDVMEPQEVAA